MNRLSKLQGSSMISKLWNRSLVPRIMLIPLKHISWGVPRLQEKTTIELNRHQISKLILRHLQRGQLVKSFNIEKCLRPEIIL